MKVTDEMVKTVAGHLLVTTNGTITGLRDGLEDALADVPSDLVTACEAALDAEAKYELLAQDYTDADADRRSLAKALKVAEAKLSQVREWAELHEMANHVDLSDLILDILKEEGE